MILSFLKANAKAALAVAVRLQAPFHRLVPIPLAAFAVAGTARLLRAPAGLAAALGLLAGWIALDPATVAHWPRTPVTRLPVAALILLVAVLARGRWQTGLNFFGRLPLAILLGWWLDGAPLGGPGLAQCVPAALGMWAALALAARFARGDAGPATLAAAASLAISLAMVGVGPHWPRAAMAPLAASLALLGLPEAVPVLAAGVAVLAVAVLLASNAGRFLPADVAVAAPWLVWWLTPRLRPRMARLGPALAGPLAALAGVALVWVAARGLAQR